MGKLLLFLMNISKKINNENIKIQSLIVVKGEMYINEYGEEEIIFL